MRNTFTQFLAATILLFGTSCAGSYTAVRPSTITNYTAVTSPNSPVEFGYSYGALSVHGRNKKYLKKERKRGYQTVAVRVKNNTATELNFSRDLELYFGDRPVMPISGLQAANDMKQGVWIYLLYAPLAATVGGTYDPQTGVTTGGTIIPWGLGVSAGNILGSSSANTNMRNEFAANDLTNKVIRPGETVTGILCLRETNVAPLHLVLRNVAIQTRPSTPTPSQIPSPAQALPAGGQ
ncbi:hypothetical protein [Hymenobacter chitinivorans]|uniref:Uncharacterized protein n=1 Tax=Hymenobacter chitinivorans DSM 11115 TaxID=1121954 RepID=A0A2M9BMP3_9BACT|nr:hypothetical protein [Hymenobacter chitinivorans]PJJ59205.1 hypothetical protein CLV45_0621 [Hymenobacter chitinivorans DSM 11115]